MKNNSFEKVIFFSDEMWEEIAEFIDNFYFWHDTEALRLLIVRGLKHFDNYEPQKYQTGNNVRKKILFPARLWDDILEHKDKKEKFVNLTQIIRNLISVGIQAERQMEKTIK